MHKHALLIVCHAYPEQLEEIVQALAAPNHWCFIHVDRKSEAMMQSAAVRRLKGADRVVILDERIRVNHGGFSQVQATLNLLRAAVDHPDAMDYFHLLSGQDFPCVSPRAFDAVFSDGRSYMHFDSPQETIEWRRKKYPGRMRLHFTDLHVPLVPRLARRALIRGLDLAARVLRPAPMPLIYAGWNWFSWHRKVVDYVLRYVVEHPQYVDRFRRGNLIDELFFHTFLYDAAEALNIEKYNSLRYVEWHPKRPTKKRLPLILDEREYDDIVASGVLFCRKVEPVDSARLKSLLKERIAADREGAASRSE